MNEAEMKRKLKKKKEEKTRGDNDDDDTWGEDLHLRAFLIYNFIKKKEGREKKIMKLFWECVCGSNSLN